MQLFFSPLIGWKDIHAFSFSYQTTTGTLIGSVVDQQNNPLPGAEVTVTDRATGFSFGKQRTDVSGCYRVDFVPPGEYDITAARAGYQPNRLTDFLVELNRTNVIRVPPIPLVPVNVTPPPPPPNIGYELTDIADATLRDSARSEFIIALPLAGIRSFDTLALLAPGVAPAPETSGPNGPSIGAGIGAAGQFSINGQRARANNFTIDGSDNNDQDVGARRQGFTPTIPQTVESIKEFQISTLLADAESGRNTGGQVNVVSRSGENIIHGQFYDLFSNSALNARDFFDLPAPNNQASKKDPFTRNQAGGSIGLPIIKNRLQLFSAFEEQDINRAETTHFAVPTMAARIAAISHGSNQELGAQLLNLYPQPNNPGGPYDENTFTNSLLADGRGTIFSLRLDYQFRAFGQPSTLSSRYNFTDDNTRLPAVGGAINAAINARSRTENLAFALETIFSDGKSNQLRCSFGRTALNFTQAAGNPLDFHSQPDNLSGPVGRLTISPFSPIGIDPFTFPQGRANNTLQLADTFIITKGKNTLKFGGDMRRVQFNSFLDRNYRPQITYTGNLIAAGNGLRLGSGLDLLGLGIAPDVQQALAITPDSHLGLRFTEYNFFINDSLRLSSRVTLNVGLRYELNTVPKDASGRLERELALNDSDFMPAIDNNQTSTFFNILADQQKFLANRREIYNGDHNNFAPRVGIAWDILGNGRFSLRGGYGLFYDQILGNIVSQSRNLFPAFIPVSFGISNIATGINLNIPAFLRVQLTDHGPLLPLILPNTINTLGVPIAQGLGDLFNDNNFGLSFTLPDKNLRTPYVHQYCITLEKSLLDKYLLSASYVGTTSEKLLRFRTPNGGPFTPIVDFGISGFSSLLNRPDRLLGAITIFDNSAAANYNALQLSMIRRAANGFALQLAYTYSHAIDDVSDIFDLAGSFALAQNELGGQQGLKAERGNANFDLRHRFTAGWQYELPFRKNSILAGFQLSGILTLQTGQPFTVNSDIDINHDGNLTDRLNTLNGLIISDRGRARISLASGVSDIDLLAPDSLKNFNGAVGRNTFRAQGIATLDLAMEKKFSLEKHSLSLRLEAFNLFNRAQFGIPVRVLEAPGFGSSVNTIVSARTLQIAVRYSF